MPSHNGRFIRYIFPHPPYRLPKASSLTPPLRRRGGNGRTGHPSRTLPAHQLAGMRKPDAPSSARRAPRATRGLERPSLDARSEGRASPPDSVQLRLKCKGREATCELAVIREMAQSDQSVPKRMQKHLVIQSLILGLLGLLNACGVAEGPAYLRFEGKVSNEEGQPLDGREVRIQLPSAGSNHAPNDRIGGEVAQTHDGGKFTVETHGIVGVVLLYPIGLIMAPVGGVIAALTPWTDSEVQEFLRPSYTFGSECLPHPKIIELMIDSTGYRMTFLEKEIVQKLYREGERKSGEPCTRVYDLGELKTSMGSPPRESDADHVVESP